MKPTFKTIFALAFLIAVLGFATGCDNDQAGTDSAITPFAANNAVLPQNAVDFTSADVIGINTDFLSLFDATGADKQAATDEIVAGLMAWNQLFGHDVQAVSLLYVGAVADNNLRNTAVRTITDPTTNYAPFGWTDEPATVSAKPMDQFTYDGNVFTAMVDGLITVGHEVYAAGWQKGSTDFTSYIVVDATGHIIYDNMLSLTTMPMTVKRSKIDSDEATPVACPDKGWTFTLTGNWLWGSERGKAQVSVHADCECEAPSCITVDEDVTVKVEDMQLGTAHAVAEFYTDKFGNREVAVALTLSTATADVDIEFDAEKLKMKVSAHGLGSSLKRTYEGFDVDCSGTCGGGHYENRNMIRFNH